MIDLKIHLLSHAAHWPWWKKRYNTLDQKQQRFNNHNIYNNNINFHPTITNIMMTNGKIMTSIVHFKRLKLQINQLMSNLKYFTNRTGNSSPICKISYVSPQNNIQVWNIVLWGNIGYDQLFDVTNDMFLWSKRYVLMLTICFWFILSWSEWCNLQTFFMQT